MAKKKISIVDESKHPALIILMLAWPVILEQILVSLVMSVDVAMVGSLGKVATASISISQSPMMMINGVVMAFGVGFTALIARSVGAGDVERSRSLVRQAMSTTLLLGIPLAALCFALARAIPMWMGAEPDVLEWATQYNQIIAMSLAFRTFSMVLTAIYRGYGDTRTPMVINTAVNLTNVVGNYLLIYGPHNVTLFGKSVHIWGAGWGVAGAAAATSLSAVLGTLVLLRYTFSTHSPMQLKLGESFKLEMATMREVTRISLPAVFERFTMGGASVVVASTVASLGTVAIAANSLASTAESFCYMPGFAFGTVATTLMGQSLGAKRVDLAQKYIATCCKIGAGIMLAFSGILFIFSGPILRIFTPDPEVIAIGSTLLKILATIQAPYTLSLIWSGALRGAGDTKSTFYITLVSMWGVRILGAVVAVRVFHLGIYAVCIAMCTDNVVRMLLFFLRYKQGLWMGTVQAAPQNIQSAKA